MRGGYGGGMRGGFGGGDRGGFGGGGPERRKWPEEKVFIGLESLRNFNVRAKVVGPGVRTLFHTFKASEGVGRVVGSAE